MFTIACMRWAFAYLNESPTYQKKHSAENQRHVNVSFPNIKQHNRDAFKLAVGLSVVEQLSNIQHLHQAVMVIQGEHICKSFYQR